MSGSTHPEAERLLESLASAGDTLFDYVVDVGSQLAGGGRDSLAVLEALEALTTAERATFRAVGRLTDAIVEGFYSPGV